MAVAALVDAPAALLLDALDAVRGTPAPLGMTPARLAVLARSAAELQGIYLQALDQAERDGAHTAAGCRSVADLLVDAGGLPVSQARSDSALSRRLGQLPGALAAVAGGGLELPAARLLCRAWAALPARLRDDATAAALLTLGGLVDLADLRAKVDELCAALALEVTDADLADARESGELSLVDVGAQTRITGHTDALTGEWLRDVLAAKAEADRGLADPRSSGGRLLDALLDTVRLALDHDDLPLADGAPPTLVVVTQPDDLLQTTDAQAAAAEPEEALADLLADLPVGPPDLVDLVRAGDRDAAAAGAGPDRSFGDPRPWRTHSRGGLPVGPRTLAALCCTSRIARVVLDARLHPVDSSPSARQLSRRERRALEHRAGYRCERAGCGRPAAVCVPHHVVPFALGGPSTLGNTVLLCRSCHHLLHDRDRDLELTGGRRIGPRGWVRSGSGPP